MLNCSVLTMMIPVIVIVYRTSSNFVVAGGETKMPSRPLHTGTLLCFYQTDENSHQFLNTCPTFTPVS